MRQTVEEELDRIFGADDGFAMTVRAPIPKAESGMTTVAAENPEVAPRCCSPHAERDRPSADARTEQGLGAHGKELPRVREPSLQAHAHQTRANCVIGHESRRSSPTAPRG